MMPSRSNPETNHRTGFDIGSRRSFDDGLHALVTQKRGHDHARSDQFRQLDGGYSRIDPGSLARFRNVDREILWPDSHNGWPGPRSGYWQAASVAGANVSTDDLSLDEVDRRTPHETGHKSSRRSRVDFCWRADLGNRALIHHNHLIRERHRLFLVVRNVQGSGADSLLNSKDLRAHLDPKFRIEIAQGFIEQEHRRCTDDGSRNGDTLLLTTRQLPWSAAEQFCNTGELRCPPGLFQRFAPLFPPRT